MALAATIGCLVGCGGTSSPGVSSPSVATQVTPTTDPAQGGSTLAPDELDWRSPLVPGEPVELVRTSTGFLVIDGHGVTALDGSGRVSSPRASSRTTPSATRCSPPRREPSSVSSTAAPATRSSGGYAALGVRCQDSARSCTVVLDARTGRRLSEVDGSPKTLLPAASGGARPGLMTDLFNPATLEAQYGYLALPRR